MQEIKVQKEIQEIDAGIIANISRELNRLTELQACLIDENNAEELRKELFTVSSIIEDVHTMGISNVRNLNRLQFVYHSLNLRLQKYEIEQEMEILSKISENINKDLIILEEKQKDLNNKQKELEEQQNKSEEKSNNLVYNLLGFLTSFSIVSAVVGVVEQIDGIVNIALFMAFTVLILLTTLIALHNFYKNDNKRENKLQDNYFLWKMIIVVIAFLIVAWIAQNITEYREDIFHYIDNKIEYVINKKIEEKNIIKN